MLAMPLLLENRALGVLEVLDAEQQELVETEQRRRGCARARRPRSGGLALLAGALIDG
jgi:hypothetical protein